MKTTFLCVKGRFIHPLKLYRRSTFGHRKIYIEMYVIFHLFCLRIYEVLQYNYVDYLECVTLHTF